MINHFRDCTFKKGQSTIMYDDPFGGSLFEADVVKEYNKKLEIDPNYPLPEVNYFLINYDILGV